MSNTTDDFFIPDNEVKLPDELDYSRAEDYIRMAQAFSHTTSQSIYIIDYFRKKFLYVSPNSMLYYKLSADEIMEMGYKFYLSFVPEVEQELLLKLNAAGFSFFHTLPMEERRNVYIQYDFHIKSGNRFLLINHKLTPLALTSDGRIWLALCVVSRSSHSSPGHVEVHFIDSSEYYKYNLVTRRWDKRIAPTLSDNEKWMMTLTIQGYTMSQIADKMCLSPDTIKKYRKQIFEKLDVRNISEAIIAAINNKIL